MIPIKVEVMRTPTEASSKIWMNSFLKMYQSVLNDPSKISGGMNRSRKVSYVSHGQIFCYRFHPPPYVGRLSKSVSQFCVQKSEHESVYNEHRSVRDLGNKIRINLLCKLC